jgi:hypothetical protein
MSNEMPPEIQTPAGEVARVERSQHILEIWKGAFSDVWITLKLVWKNPANGLQEALATLGDTRAFNAGLILCALFVLACWIAVLKAVNLLGGFASLIGGGFGSSFYGGSFGQLDLSAHIRILLSITTPIAGMILVLWIARQIFKGVGNLKQLTLVTGVAVIPITFFMLLLWLLGNSSMEVMSLASLFCCTTFILLLNTALIGVIRLSTRNTILIVPMLLVADLLITKVVFEILY